MRSILIPVTICSLLVTGKMQANANTVCMPTTVGQLSLQTNTNLLDSFLESAGAGIAVIALGKARPLVRAGAVILLLKPLKDLITNYDQKQQLDSRPEWNSDTKIKVCGTEDSLLTTLGFRELEPAPKLKIDPSKVVIVRPQALGIVDHIDFAAVVASLSKSPAMPLGKYMESITPAPKK